MNGTISMVSVGLDTTGRDRDTTELELGHNMASAQWDWGTVGDTTGLESGHNRTSAQWDWDTVEQGHNGTISGHNWISMH